jgi:hypothetical protein
MYSARSSVWADALSMVTEQAIAKATAKIERTMELKILRKMGGNISAVYMNGSVG